MQAFRHRANFSERAQSSRHQEDNVDRDTCWKGDSRERSSRHQDNDVNRDVRWKGDLRERSSRHQDNAGHRDARREVDSRERSQSYHQDNEKKPHARCNALPPLAPVAVSSIVDLTTESPISFCRSINYNDNDLDAPSLPPRAFFGHKIVSVTQSLPRRKISRPYLAPRLSRAEQLVVASSSDIDDRKIAARPTACPEDDYLSFPASASNGSRGSTSLVATVVRGNLDDHLDNENK